MFLRETFRYRRSFCSEDRQCGRCPTYNATFTDEWISRKNFTGESDDNKTGHESFIDVLKMKKNPAGRIPG